MSAADEIQAAIEKLLDLREESTPGQWYDLADCVYSEGEWVIGDASNADDTPLIVTLHATIDAQLAFLHEAKHQISTGDGFIQKELNLFLRLSTAINGATS